MHDNMVDWQKELKEGFNEVLDKKEHFVGAIT